MVENLAREERMDNSREPLISVIMSVYNCEDTLEEATESIGSQTYTNWEFIICDDASTDGTLRLLEELAELEPRITVIANGENRRLAYSLNRCLEIASGEYIARMDGDDVSEPDRFARQLEYLVEHPEYDLVGTSMRRFNADGPGEVIYPASLAPDKWTMGKSSKAPFFHATILARREAFERVGNYTVAWHTTRSEDVDLWFKFFAEGLTGRNLLEPLYLVREDAAAIRRRTARTRFESYVTYVRGSWVLGYPPQAYIRATANLAKVLLPYRVFDWHRAWTRRRAVAAVAGSERDA